VGVTTDPPAGLEYHQLHRGGRAGWGRTLAGVLAVGALVMVVAPQVVALLFLVGHRAAVPGGDRAELLDRLGGGELTPVRLAYTSLSLAAGIVVVMAVTRLVHGRRPGWVASVRPRLRWGWLLTCAALSVLALGVTMVVASYIDQGAAGTATAGSAAGLNRFTDTTRDFLLVIAVLTPLQAAGEEYVFRGYLTQAFGGITGSRVVAVVLPAVLFALAHGPQEVPVFIDRLAFGIVAGVLVIATGGLEAGIAMHVVNNFVAFGVALAFGDITTVVDPSGSSWWQIAVTLVRSLVFLALVLWAARRAGLAVRSGQGRPDFASGSPRM